MPTTWASTSVFSPDRPAKRPVGARRILPSSRAGPNPLGENQSLSSPPLEPRGLLLSVMRQKVGKERSQEGCAPLANPQRFLACPLRKFGPSPTPLRRFAPGRTGRATLRVAKSSARDSAPFSAYSRLVETGGRRHPRRKAGAARHAKTGACFDNYRRAADPKASSQTSFPPHGHCPRALAIHSILRSAK
jgi:hypothetical protein